MTETVQVNADLSARAVVHTADMAWQPSPSATVWRKRLYLDGPPEAGRVTSIVRYDADSAFPRHTHPDGVFSDENGDHPAGSYLLNPDGTSHAPRSRDGCTLFVRLRQYAGANRMQVAMNTAALQWQERAPGIWHKPLYRQGGYREWTALLRLDAGAEGPWHDHPAGEEMFVIDGEIADDDGVYPAGTWIRNPPGSAHRIRSDKGAVLLVQFGAVAG